MNYFQFDWYSGGFNVVDGTEQLGHFVGQFQRPVLATVEQGYEGHGLRQAALSTGQQMLGRDDAQGAKSSTDLVVERQTIAVVVDGERILGISPCYLLDASVIEYNMINELIDI